MKKLLLALFFCFCFVSAMAQVSLTASVNKTALALDDEITLTVEIRGVSGNMIMPQLPSLPAFNVYSREVEQSTVNGHTTTVFRYVMLPRFVGKTSIGEVSFTYDGKTYKTEPISVTIFRHAQGVTNTGGASSGARRNSAGNYDSAFAKVPKVDPNLPPLESSLANLAYAHAEDAFFMVAAVSDKTPYVNQTITLAVRFYYSNSFYDAPYQKPSVTNIFMESAGSAQGTQSINSVLYRYEEQRYHLTAAAPGKATIGPASIRFQTGSSPFTAFDRLFGGAAVSETQTVASDPITLQVRAFPQDGKPKSFYGAVGEGFVLQAQADPTRVEAGEAVNLTVTVKGPGNLKPTTDLVFPVLDGFKMYNTAATSGSLPANGQARSYKIFKAVLVPSASGIYTIPEIKWSYFNPKTSSYKTLRTQPIQIQVSPSSKTEAGFDFGAQGSGPSGFHTLGSDIAYLKSTLAPEAGFLTKVSALAWINWLAGALLFVSVLFALFGRKTLAQKRAYSQAKALLKASPNEEAVADAVAGYLQQKFKISTGSLPLKSIVNMLGKKGVTPATAEAFSLLWQRLDAARFAPTEKDAQNTRNLAAQALDVLTLMEEETK